MEYKERGKLEEEDDGGFGLQAWISSQINTCKEGKGRRKFQQVSYADEMKRGGNEGWTMGLYGLEFWKLPFSPNRVKCLK